LFKKEHHKPVEVHHFELLEECRRFPRFESRNKFDACGEHTSNAPDHPRLQPLHEAGGPASELTIQPERPMADRYNELLYAVARKFAGESRHETALRYIREAEEAHDVRGTPPFTHER
jgi:hypothetical protein